MEKATYTSLLIQGYTPIPEGKNPEDIIRYQIIDLSREDLFNIALGKPAFSKDGDEMVFVRFQQPMVITPDELIYFLEDAIKDEKNADVWDFVSRLNYGLGDRLFFEPQPEKSGLPKGDYDFLGPEHCVKFILTLLRQHQGNDIIDDAKSYITFLRETDCKGKTPEERAFSDSTLSLILLNLADAFDEEGEGDSSKLGFYKRNLMELATKGDPSSIRLLGYHYYEGNNGFEADGEKALYYLKKAYELRNDPDVARTLGYIYYYGKGNKGVPEPDKAFQYFAIGHIAGGLYEATYKLADCYVKGYGTPISHQAAFNLVQGIYRPTKDAFLEGEDFSKFADVALRLGNYYRNGIYVQREPMSAFHYYLEASCAIRERLKSGEYIGDRGVASGIFHSLQDLRRELALEPVRDIVADGYLLKDYSGSASDSHFLFTLLNENTLRVVIEPNGEGECEYLFVHAPLGLAERTKDVTFVLHGHFDEELINRLRDIEASGASIQQDGIAFEKEGEAEWVFVPYEQIIYAPKTLQNLAKIYQIVSVEVEGWRKSYDYLCEREDVKPGDLVTINSRDGEKRGSVKEVYLCYEDQLPLPLKKMGVAV